MAHDGRVRWPHHLEHARRDGTPQGTLLALDSSPGASLAQVQLAGGQLHAELLSMTGASEPCSTDGARERTSTASGGGWAGPGSLHSTCLGVRAPRLLGRPEPRLAAGCPTEPHGVLERLRARA